MCDSIEAVFHLDHPLTTEVYEECRFPQQPLDAGIFSSDIFREHIVVSPTGAQYKITPLGALMPGSSNRRFEQGRIYAYLVSANIPACTSGHNRLLVNGVPQALLAAGRLLKIWLAMNGCTAQGLEYIKPKNAVMVSVTLTMLYLLDTAELAREALRNFRLHAEAVMNMTRKKGAGKPRVNSFPLDSLESGPAKSYTTYVHLREFLISAYIKELDQPGAYCLPLDDARAEVEMQALALRTLRVEVMVHGKWLRDNDLHTFNAWVGRTEPYERVFGLLRQTLRLDENLRAKRLRISTVQNLALSPREKKYLEFHLKGGVVREHPDKFKYQVGAWHRIYSAVNLKLIDCCGIDLDIPYTVQIKMMNAKLVDLLTFPGEFAPAEHLAGYLYSRTSMPFVRREHEEMITAILADGGAAIHVPPKVTYYRGPLPKPRRMYGISQAPIYVTSHATDGLYGSHCD